MEIYAFLGFMRKSCTQAHVGHLRFPLEGSSKPCHKNVGSREELNRLISVKGAGQEEAHVWDQEEHTVPGTARNHQPQNPAWPWG